MCEKSDEVVLRAGSASVTEACVWCLKLEVG